MRRLPPCVERTVFFRPRFLCGPPVLSPCWRFKPSRLISFSLSLLSFSLFSVHGQSVASKRLSLRNSLTLSIAVHTNKNFTKIPDIAFRLSEGKKVPRHLISMHIPFGLVKSAPLDKVLFRADAEDKVSRAWWVPIARCDNGVSNSGEKKMATAGSFRSLGLQVNSNWLNGL